MTFELSNISYAVISALVGNDSITNNTDIQPVAYQKEHIVEGIGALTIAPNDSGPPILSMEFDEPMELNSGLDIAHELRKLIDAVHALSCPGRES